MQRELGLRQQ